MIKSIATINALLVDIKTLNGSLPVKLQHAGFDLSLPTGHEEEYTVSSLINIIDTLTIQFLTITANRNQFIQRTSYAERQDIESLLLKLFICLKQTVNTLELSDHHISATNIDKALAYISDTGETIALSLIKAVDYIDQLKPYSRMLELVIAQQRIHALSAVLETLLHNEERSPRFEQDDGHELTEEQHNALELSHYLVKQAL